MFISKQQLLEEFPEHEVTFAESSLKDLVVVAPTIVYAWVEAPKWLTDLVCFNGGDSDWVVITKPYQYNNWTPSWIEHTDSCLEPDVYYFENATVYVGNHA